MGDAYRAKDTKLNRDVALKILPDLFAADPDRRARFQREAQVLASLNHPNSEPDGKRPSSSPPNGVSAGAVSSTEIEVVWNAAPGATSYQIDRQGAGGAFSQIGTSTTTTFSDTTATADSAYLYRVRSVNGAGVSISSAADIATTIIFVDNPLAAGITVKAVHLAQRRTAVNAVRLLAGLPAATFTDTATAGTAIRALHVTELREALDPALESLGRATSAYTDQSLTGVAIKAVHLQELRDRVY